MVPSDIARIVRDPRSKVKRAKSHIDTLVRELAVMPKDLYVVRNGVGYSNLALRQPDRFNLTFIPEEPIPEHYQGIIGDVVNNLRESLEYLMTRVYRAAGGKSRVHFPFSQLREELPNSPFWKKIEAVTPRTTKLIETEVSPCEDGNTHLWRVNKLWNLNKHNDFVPTLTDAVVRIDHISSGGNTIENCSVGFDANKIGNIMFSAHPIAIDGNVHVSSKIQFAEGSYFAGEPVIPTLAQIAQVVTETIDIFERPLKDGQIP